MPNSKFQLCSRAVGINCCIWHFLRSWCESVYYHVCHCGAWVVRQCLCQVRTGITFLKIKIAKIYLSIYSQVSLNLKTPSLTTSGNNNIRTRTLLRYRTQNRNLSYRFRDSFWTGLCSRTTFLSSWAPLDHLLSPRR
jgi:hypothetical protein